jgi:formylglycine-generating enzyme required for sulfatase activity
LNSICTISLSEYALVFVKLIKSRKITNGKEMMLARTNCQTELPHNARFCYGCGQIVAKAANCRAYKVELPEGARFCLSCGALVKAIESAPKRVDTKPLASRSLTKEALTKNRLSSADGKITPENKKRLAKAKRQHTTRKEHLNSLLISDKDFVSISAGTFVMGSTAESDEKQHRVDIDAFNLMDSPVTFSQCDQYCENTGKEKPGDENWGRGDRPVIRVRYWDAVDFAKWVTRKSGMEHRLPTEAEWEYACRAGTDTAFEWGDNPDQLRMNYDNEIGQTIPAKTLGIHARNSWKLFDMHGNVWEWCASLYDKDYDGAEQKDASSSRSAAPRVLRGVSWAFFASRAKPASRFHTSPSYSNIYWGFRLARPK